MTKATERQISNSFGFDPAESTHHFVVAVPRAATEPVVISEHYTWDDTAGSGEASLSARGDGQIRVFLPRPKWNAIADEMRAQFNQRLKRQGRKPGSWQVGPNLLRRESGQGAAAAGLGH